MKKFYSIIIFWIIFSLFSNAQETDSILLKDYQEKAEVLIDSGKYEQALVYNQQALEIRLTQLGNEHPDVAQFYNNIGTNYYYLNDHENALASYQKALEIRLNALGNQHLDVAQSYNNIASSYQKQNDYDKAINFFQKSLNIRLANLGEQHPDVAQSYNHLGAVYWYLEDYEKALTSYQNSLKIRIAVFGPNHPEVARSYDNIGLIYHNKGDLEKTLAYYQKALKIWLASSDEYQPELARCFSSIGLIYEYSGNYDKALEFYQKTLEVRLATLTEDHPDVMMSYGDLGEVYWRKGNHNKALDFFEKNLEIRLATLGQEHLDVAVSYNNIAAIYQNKGDYGKAEEFFQKVLKIRLAKLEKGHIKVAYAYDNIGLNCKNRGDYDRALIFYQRALETYLSVLSKDDLDVALSYSYIGEIYEITHDYDIALEYYQKALDIRLARLGTVHPDVAFSYINIGLIYGEKGDFDKTLAWHQKALAIQLPMLGEDHPDVALSYNNIGLVFKNKRDYAQALEYYEKSLELWLAIFGDDHPNVAAAYINIGQIYRITGEYDKAGEYYQRALAIMQMVFGEANAQTAQIYNHISQIYLLKKEFKMATSFARKAINSMDQMRTMYTSSETKRIHLSDNFAIFENAIHTQVKATESDSSKFDIEKAFLYSEKAKSNLLLEALQTTHAESFANIPDSLLQKEYDLRIDIAYYDKIQFEEQQRGETQRDSLIHFYSGKLFDLRQTYDALIAGFERDFPDYYQLKYETKVPSAQEVQYLLEEDEALIEYFVGDSTIYAFVITKKGFRMEIIEQNFPLEQWVNDLRKGLYDYHYGKNQTEVLYHQTNALFVENATALYNKLLRPLGILPKKLIVVPDGVLSYVPFEVLLTERPSQDHLFQSHAYLFRKHQISYNFSATLWQWMKSQEHSSEKGFLAFAPGFPEAVNQNKDIAELRRGLGPLRFNIPEAEAIHQLVGGEILTGEDATTTNFKTAAPNHGILHFATHAKVDDRDVNYSFLAFSQSDDSLDNGKVFIRELYDLQLRADLVVLSACETGIGELRRGEGVVSLARGFAYAGAKSIVTSLWSVNDQSTASIMEDFYRNLKKGMPKDEALREAKLHYLETQKDPLYAHPFYWAAFVAIGDMEAVEGGWRVPRFWIVVGLLGLGLLWFLARKRRV